MRYLRKMSTFKKWLDGEQDIFNQEIPVKDLKDIEKIDEEELEKSILVTIAKKYNKDN